MLKPLKGALTLPCDLWQDDERNPKPEHEWPSEDYWLFFEIEHCWSVPNPSGGTEDE